MGEKEVDEYAEIPQQRRTSSISRMLKQLTTRIGLGDRRASDKRPHIPRGADQGAAVAPPPGATAGVQPTSRDSFAESRKNKMKQTHRDRQRHEHHGSSGGKKRSVFGGKASLDLNQVNEVLKTQMPAGHSENLTYRRAGQCAHSGMRSSSSPPRGDKQADDSLSLSTNEEDAAANPVVTQRMRQAARGMERMARAQQLLNRVKDLGDPCVDETPSSRPQASSGKGNPMARRAAPPVQAPA
ncbi:hypothetical protein B0T11DRAFT_285135 [Plectosphaerella cucumerina]|uniref:Uncharacterized protein n=1 Tax=Plectosphaerella cucumerina TaxID=40658 RepID=A0A8K0TBY4_9PEZI|nr:hypothetical protein B0T11DRAFT_285135 [Plectosphaerella cucumerina]